MKHGRHRVFFYMSRKFYDCEGYVMEYTYDGVTMEVTNILMVL